MTARNSSRMATEGGRSARPLPALLLCLACTWASATAAAAPDIETLMTPEDFTRSGLDRLSDEQRAHLSAWLERYREGRLTGPEPPKTPEQRQQERAAEVDIVAKVVPRFSGWSGKTVFRLDNGQVWQQRQTGSLRYSGGDSTVVISKNIIGKYMLKHPDTGRAVGVRRIE